MSTLHFHVIGTPAPQGSKRAYVNARTGRAQLVESSAKVAPWRGLVAAAAIDALDAHPDWPRDAAAVTLLLEFFLARPKSAPKSRTHPTTRPDLDKLVRSTLDALTAAGLYVDDSRVISIEAHKAYATRWTGVEVYASDYVL